MKNKIILCLVIILGLFTLTGCVSDKEELVSADSKLIGIWTMTDAKNNPEDNADMDSMSIQFFEDGKCVYSYRALTGSNKTLTFEGKVEGTCYVNSNYNKIRVDAESNANIFSKWQSLKINDNTMTIGNYTFVKKQ